MLREDLSLHRAPTLPDGQPSWSIQDPARNQFFRIDWQTFEILKRWSFDDTAAIVNDINEATTLRIEDKDVQLVIDFLLDNQLLTPNGKDPSKAMADKERRQKSSRLTRLLKNYLFFRLPLVRPDRFLGATLHWVAPFFSRTFALLTLFVFALSLMLVYRDLDRFTETWVDMFTWQGMLAYGAALIFVKVLHELGHAYTAKRYGCKIPTMGVAFLVMWPVAYTDTNDAWSLADRNKRLDVVGAGVLTELAVAVWATLAWAVLPPGTLKDVAFLLSTTTWIATLLINASPFLRFDGYFFLSDWLDMPNLHQRSSALARWRLRELLFNLQASPPEYFSRARTNGLILFAYLTWLYRFFLFIGIALLVYHFFFKALGIFLFVLEIYWFIARPIFSEILEWYRLLAVIRKRRRSYASGLTTFGLLSALMLPWPTGVSAPAILQSAKVFPIYAPANARLTQRPAGDGHGVVQGERLFAMTSPELDMRKEQAASLLEHQQWSIEAVSVDAGLRGDYQVHEQTFLLARSVAHEVEVDTLRHKPSAPFDGTVRNLNPDLRVGTWVRAGEKLGVLVRDGSCAVEAYVRETDLGRIRPGDTAVFYADAAVGEFLSLQVTRIDQDASRVLTHELLASQAGGSVKAREANGLFFPEPAVYRTLLSCDDMPQKLVDRLWRGKVVIHGEWRAPLERYWHSLAALLVREMGF